MEDSRPAPGEQTGSHSDFRDPTMLTRWTRVFLYASIALSLLSVWEVASGLPGDVGEGRQSQRQAAGRGPTCTSRRDGRWAGTSCRSRGSGNRIRP